MLYAYTISTSPYPYTYQIVRNGDLGHMNISFRRKNPSEYYFEWKFIWMKIFSLLLVCLRSQPFLRGSSERVCFLSRYHSLGVVVYRYNRIILYYRNSTQFVDGEWNLRIGCLQFQYHILIYLWIVEKVYVFISLTAFKLYEYK